jgi:hypothetical protein
MKQPTIPSNKNTTAMNGPTKLPQAIFPLRPVVLNGAGVGARASASLPPGNAAMLSTSGVGAGNTASKHDADRKAFKGRGTARRIRQARCAVDKVHLEMRQLAELTKTIKARRFYLAVHSRGATGQLSLRWRKAGVADTSHIAWDELDSFLQTLPPDLIRWYQTVNTMALALNGQEKLLRSSLRYTVEAGNQSPQPDSFNETLHMNHPPANI